MNIKTVKLNFGQIFFFLFFCLFYIYLAKEMHSGIDYINIYKLQSSFY